MSGVTYIKFDYQSLAERWIFYPQQRVTQWGRGIAFTVHSWYCAFLRPMGNGYDKKRLENFLFLPLKAKGFTWYVGSKFRFHRSPCMLPYLTLLMPNIKNRNQLYSKGTKTDWNHMKCNFIPCRSFSRSISVSNGNVHNCLSREWNRSFRFHWT